MGLTRNKKTYIGGPYKPRSFPVLSCIGILGVFILSMPQMLDWYVSPVSMIIQLVSTSTVCHLFPEADSRGRINRVIIYLEAPS